MEGREEITDQRAQQVLESFQSVVPPSRWLVHMNQFINTLQLQVDRPFPASDGGGFPSSRQVNFIEKWKV